LLFAFILAVGVPLPSRLIAALADDKLSAPPSCVVEANQLKWRSKWKIKEEDRSA
jgi:hypothetical protein